MGGGLDPEIRCGMRRVEHRYARCVHSEHRLQLPDVQVVRAEVGEEDDQAAFFAAGFAASAAVSGWSISETSASGALSPLRKPFFRIRR